MTALPAAKTNSPNGPKQTPKMLFTSLTAGQICPAIELMTDLS